MSNTTNRLQKYMLILPYAVSNKQIKIKDLAALLDISEKELVQDLDKLSMCGVPDYGPDSFINPNIDPDGNLTVYFADYFPRPVRLTPNEAIAILHALSLFRKISKKAVSLETIQSVEDKIRKCLPDNFAGNIYDAKGLIKFDKFQGPIADTLHAGCSDTRSIDIEYIAQNGSKTSRMIDPLSIVCFHGKWYVIAFCDLRRALRMFLFKRIVEAKDTGIEFERSVDYKPDEYMSAFFYPTKKDIKVKIRFSPALSRMVEENWSATQIESLDDGSSIVTLYTKSFSWLLGPLLTWGTDAKVLEPVELRDRLLQIVAEKCSLA